MRRYGSFIIFERIFLVITALAIGIWIFWLEAIPQAALRYETAISIVGTIASLCASLLGFIIAAIIFLLGLAEAQAFKIIRASKSYGDLWALFKGAMLSCSVTLAIAMISILSIWFGHMPQILVWALLSSSTWLLLRIARISWVLHLIIDAEVQRGVSTRKKIERS